MNFQKRVIPLEERKRRSESVKKKLEDSVYRQQWIKNSSKANKHGKRKKRDSNSKSEQDRFKKQSMTILKKLSEDSEYKKKWIEKTKLSGRKGYETILAKGTFSLGGFSMIGKKQSQEVVQKRINTFNKLREQNPNIFRTGSKNSHKYEDEIAKQIQGNLIFKPCEVCDRIVIRNGEIYFVEIKLNGQKLRPKQKQFQQIAKDKYEVLYGSKFCVSDIPEIILRS